MDEKELFDSSIQVLTKNLPVLRKMLGLTQSEFADIVGLSRQTVVNIENENQKMKRTTFMAMMYLFSLNRKTAVFLKELDIPYKELKKWLRYKTNT